MHDEDNALHGNLALVRAAQMLAESPADYDRAVVALRETRGRPLTFHEDMLAEAVSELAHEGLWQEYSGAAGLAALREGALPFATPT